MTASKSLGIVAVVALAAILLTALATSPAFAGKPDHANGGNGNGNTEKCKGGPKKCSQAGTEELTVTPNPVPLGSQSVEISGTGFAPNQDFGVYVFSVCCGMLATSDSNGDFTVTFYRDFDWPSSYTVNVYSSESLVATTTFTVE
jgi:hypothetical protein